MIFRVILSSVLLVSASQAAIAQGQINTDAMSICASMIQLSEKESRLMSYSEVQSQKMRNFCEIESSDVSSIRTAATTASAEVDWYASGDFSQNMTDSQIEKRHRELCDAMYESDFRIGETDEASFGPMGEVFPIVESCMKGVLSENRRASAIVYPVGDGVEKFLIRVLTRPKNTQPISVTLTPKDVTCYDGDHKIGNNYSTNETTIDLECSKPSDYSGAMLLKTSVEDVGALELTGVGKHDSIQISPESFYGDFEYNSFVITEIEIRDRKNRKIPITNATADTCSPTCSETIHLKHIYDGSSDPNWEDGNPRWWSHALMTQSDDKGKRISLEFEPSTVGSIAIYQWAAADCMADCKSNYKKHQAFAKYLLIGFDGRQPLVYRAPESAVAKIRIGPTLR